MIDEPFICDNCHKQVGPLKYTARDHCPNCLYSKHVDINPGDRQETCRGMLKPIAILNVKKTFQIVYKCEKCQAIRKNIIANDDNMDIIIDIMSHPTKYE